jgi:hypothetical protein
VFRAHRYAGLVLVALAAACGPPAARTEDGGWVDEEVDAGEDAGTSDGGLADSGASDSGPNDAGFDAGVDAGFDAGSVDGGVPCTVGGVPGLCLNVAACVGNQQPTPGYCPGPAQIQCCTPKPAQACDELAKPLPNAGLTEEPGIGGCPSGMTPVTTFCVDRFEASLVQLDGGSWSPFWNPGVVPVKAVSLRAAVPQGYLDGVQAGDACAAAGKRLCTDAEWLRACRGPGNTTYPYGNTRQPGVCNDARSVHPAVEYYGTTASWIYSKIQNPCLNQLPASLDLTGSNAGCLTAEGAYDMMGNLHEWTADPAGTFRGGYYVDTVINGAGCLYVTTAHNTLHWDYSTGFRCCATP